MNKRDMIAMILLSLVTLSAFAMVGVTIHNEGQEEAMEESRIREVSQNYCEEIEALKAFILKDAEESYARRFATIRLLRLEPTPTVLREFDREVDQARRDFSPIPCPRPRS